MKLRRFFIPLVILLVATACGETRGQGVIPSPTLAARAAAPATATPPARALVPSTFTPSPSESVDAEATSTVTRSPTASPTATILPPAATPTLVRFTPPPATATRPSPTPLTPAIASFDLVSAEEIETGRRLTFRWQATGAAAHLFSGTAQRMPPWWVVPVSGELTVELPGTFYRNPEFTLYVFGGEPDSASPVPQATATVQVEWPCAHDYFFTPAPRRCPLDAPTPTAAAEQQFEGGSMLWLGSEDAIFVLYPDGTWQRYPDTWDENQPATDPSLNPPAGRYQPRRGFGLVWREQPGVRQLLGWALGEEKGFDSYIQYEQHEGSSSGAPTYVRRLDGSTISLHPFWTTMGNWHQEAP